MKYIKTLIITTFILITNNAFACKCVNPDINELFDKSDIVVLATPSKEFSNDKQSVSVHKLIKGEIPQTGLFLNQQNSSCGYPQLPMSHEQQYLLFVSKSGEEYKLSSRCYNYTHRKGIFNLRMGDEYVNMHGNMLGPFFNSKGKSPKIDLYTSYSANEKGVENWLSITNLEEREIEIFHPSNPQAFTFFVIDQYGNVVEPKGYAKVSPKGGVLTIPAGGIYKHKIEPVSNLYFPYLSGTAQFGYSLEKNNRYRMHVVYRPFGGTYGAVFSKEKEISF
ncbi:MAG: hypothetical protein L3J24_14485 [Xanthomonadales bacterium]|nr:hypothetical protein [Xanthomonadales bacterium]